MTKQVPVRVCRATKVPLGGDLFTWIDRVWQALSREFEAFEGRDPWDVWPEEVHLDHTIVRNGAKGKVFRAEIVVDAEKETVSFRNIQRVTHQWVPMDEESVKRGESQDPPDLQTVLVNREDSKSSLFGSLFG